MHIFSKIKKKSLEHCNSSVLPKERTATNATRRHVLCKGSVPHCCHSHRCHAHWNFRFVRFVYVYRTSRHTHLLLNHAAPAPASPPRARSSHKSNSVLNAFCSPHAQYGFSAICPSFTPIAKLSRSSSSHHHFQLLKILVRMPPSSLSSPFFIQFFTKPSIISTAVF